jgi:hypothetical protein
MNSSSTQRILVNTLCKYIQKHISCIDSGTDFHLPSRSNLAYWDIAQFLKGNNDKYYTQKLSDLVAHIINNNYSELYKSINNYYGVVNSNVKRKIIQLYSQLILDEPKFEYFEFFINTDLPLDKISIIKLKEYLSNTLNEKTIVPKGLTKYPRTDVYEELSEVAFWCNNGYLDSDDFVDFYGLNDRADFYFNFETFDYSKFNINWLFNISDYACEMISKNTKAKTSIKSYLQEFLKNNRVDAKNKDRLINILINWFN